MALKIPNYHNKDSFFCSHLNGPLWSLGEQLRAFGSFSNNCMSEASNIGLTKAIAMAFLLGIDS